ncbi:hypothetical protein TIFTF001_055096 [Ficus carica]|uniref:Uncharacterized protein n=1 Tax=Ficus carica TaxID=3494 RepID=A0AA88EGC4_FICCA|nr:hypothetical protein TIFTF001_055093 [Ficus carica]GMN70882.1 hypothetical protein TIFTF001_055094 [Ficus carica]GMN70886.1 hypothetical protein TIFTF001_055095 [Ficus carica]GMN70892.1 hypothetical protein TIFTF001_055096 [Ficus carica]
MPRSPIRQSLLPATAAMEGFLVRQPFETGSRQWPLASLRIPGPRDGERGYMVKILVVEVILQAEESALGDQAKG